MRSSSCSSYRHPSACRILVCSPFIILSAFISFQNVLRTLDQIIPPVQLEHPENHWRATYILTTAYEINFDYPSEFYDHVTILWADAGVKLGLKRYVERTCLDVAK
jgi:hypothetical protein